MLQTLFAAAIFAFLLHHFIPHPPLQWLMAVLSLLCILATILRVKPFVRILGGVFLVSGLLMLIGGGVEAPRYVLAFGKMLNLLSLFALIPILALPIRLGNYGQAVREIIQKKVKQSSQLYMLTSSLSYFLSSFMNLASIPMMYYSIRPSADLFPIQQKERFMSRSVTHGFSMPIIWAPVAPIVGIVVEMTGVSWGSVLPILLPLSLLGLLLDWLTGVLIASKRKKEEGYPSPQEWERVRSEISASQAAEAQDRRGGKLWHILLAILLFNGLVTILEQQLQFSFLLLITLMVIPFAFGWSLCLQEGKGFAQGLKDHFRTHLFKMKDQFFLFLSAGFFISALQFSGAEQVLNDWILTFKNGIGNHLFISLIPLIPFLLAFAGLHPVVSLALVAGVLDPEILNISPKVLVVAMLGGAVTAFLMGPYNATLGMMANIVKESPFRVSKWNGSFTLCYLLMIIATVTLMQVLLG